MGTRDELLRKREAREAGLDPNAPAPPRAEHEAELASIKERADVVRETHAAFEEAIMEERQVARDILTRAIGYAAPALVALSGKIKKRSETITCDSNGSPGAGDKLVSEEHHDKRGVLLVDKFNAVQHDRDARGSYGGICLYLYEDGQLAFGRRQGSWSRVPGESSTIELQLRAVTHEEAVGMFRVDQILAGLSASLENQDGLAGATEKVRARVAKLSVALAAIHEMLR